MGRASQKEHNMDEFNAQLAALRQTLVDLDGDGIPDGQFAGEASYQVPTNVLPGPSLYPGHENFEPMTGVQREQSRRMATGDGLSNALVSMTGLPMINQGVNDANSGMRSGNPMQVARGVGTTALGAMPWTRAGRTLMGAAPVTTTGSYMTVPNLDVSMPKANASEAGIPPLPVSRQSAMAPVQQEARQGVAPEQAPWWQTMAGQVANNAGHVVNYLTNAAGEAYREFTGSGGYEAPSYEEWVAKNGASQMAAIRAAEEASRRNIPGVFSNTSNEIREREVQKAEQLRQDLRTRYDQEIARGKQEYKNSLNTQRFAERNPTLATTMKLAPVLAAGGMYGRAMRRHANDVQRRTQGIGSMPQGPAKNAAMDDLAVLANRQPSMLQYGAGGFAGSGLGKGIEDVVDLTALPPDSEARKETARQFSTIEGGIDYATGLGARALMSGAGVMAGGFFGGKRLTPGQIADARTAAGLPNYEAMRLRQIAGEKAARVSDRQGRFDLQGEQMAARKYRERMTTLIDDIGVDPATAGRLKFGETIPQFIQRMQKSASRGKKMPSPDPSPPNDPGPGGSSQLPLPQSSPLGGGTSPVPPASVSLPQVPPKPPGSPSGQGQSSRAQSFRKPSKINIVSTFAENNGTISAKQLGEIAPNVPKNKLEEYSKKLTEALKDLGPENFKKALKHFPGLSSIVGGSAVGASMMDYE